MVNLVAPLQETKGLEVRQETNEMQEQIQVPTFLSGVMALSLRWVRDVVVVEGWIVFDVPPG